MLTRHPLLRNARTATNQKIPGAINVCYADGHTARLLLQKMKSVIWHRDYVPSEDPWTTAPR
jgi:prepilin-type processing-associated H-X9-DG protein